MNMYLSFLLMSEIGNRDFGALHLSDTFEYKLLLSKLLFVFVLTPFTEFNHVFYFFTTFIIFEIRHKLYISSQIKI